MRRQRRETSNLKSKPGWFRRQLRTHRMSITSWIANNIYLSVQPTGFYISHPTGNTKLREKASLKRTLRRVRCKSAGFRNTHWRSNVAVNQNVVHVISIDSKTTISNSAVYERRRTRRRTRRLNVRYRLGVTIEFAIVIIRNCDIFKIKNKSCKAICSSARTDDAEPCRKWRHEFSRISQRKNQMKRIWLHIGSTWTEDMFNATTEPVESQPVAATKQSKTTYFAYLSSAAWQVIRH